MAKRTAIYARVSTDDQAKHGYSLPSQLEACRRRAEERGWKVVDEITDEGVSGATLDRPGLDRIREMAESGEIEAVVVYELDRLARRAVYQMLIEEELTKLGVTIHYVLGNYDDTDEGRLQKQVRAAIAEYERAKICERSKRGKRSKAKAGFVTGGGHAPYGYGFVRHENGMHLAIDDTEARVVGMIYNWYVFGGDGSPLSIHEVVKRLSEMGFPTRWDKGRGQKKRGYGVWSSSTVRGILRNETYTGTWHYGKSQVVNGRQVPVPRENWVPVSVPPQVERRVWEMAQQRLDKRAKRRTALREYLVGGRVSCGHCGNSARGCYSRNRKLDREYLYYHCTAVDGYRPGVTCNLSSFHAEAVDAAVWEWVRRLLTDPQALAGGLQAEQDERERANAPLSERLTLVDGLLADNRQQLQRLLDLYLAGDFPREILTERRARLQETIVALERERADLVAHLETQSLTDEQIATITEFARHVAQGLEAAEEDFETRRRVLDTLDVRVRLAVEDGARVVYALCLVSDTKLVIQKDTSS